MRPTTHPGCPLVLIRFQPPAPTSFRQSVQTHTDWVNAMVLCNMNQTVITASSDRTIRAWSPHAEGDLSVPALIGHHTDYVRSLAFARHPGVLFSGALDRDISVWDINQPRPNEPVLKVRLSDIDDLGGIGDGDWGSIYALGVGEFCCAAAVVVVRRQGLEAYVDHQTPPDTLLRPARPNASCASGTRVPATTR